MPMATLAPAETLLPALDPTGRRFARLDEAEREWLGTLLRPLPWIDGLMTATLIAPDWADDSDETEIWLDYVWRQGGKAEFQRLAPAQSREVVSVVMGQFGHIGVTLIERPEAYRPYLSGANNPLQAAAQWADGFRVGAHLSLDAWTLLIEDNGARTLLAAVFGLMPDETLAEDLRARSPFHDMSADERARLRHGTVEMLPQIVLSLRDRMQDLDEANAEYAEPYVRRTPKVGRNDPCPCGSGRKYKRCCLDR
jgi:uncharacterized protein